MSEEEQVSLPWKFIILNLGKLLRYRFVAFCPNKFSPKIFKESDLEQPGLPTIIRGSRVIIDTKATKVFSLSARFGAIPDCEIFNRLRKSLSSNYLTS